MKDGVQYVLRFARSPASDEKDDAKDEAKDKEKSRKSRPPRASTATCSSWPSSTATRLQNRNQPCPPRKPAEDKRRRPKGRRKEAEEKGRRQGQAGSGRTGRIEKENKRSRTNTSRRSDGEKRVQSNARFADWYYVIADNVYQKIHLNRAKLVEKEKPRKTPPRLLPTPAEFKDLKAAARASRGETREGAQATRKTQARREGTQARARQ